MEISQIKELLLPYLEQNQLELYDISFVREYGYSILRVLIDKDGGIDIDELAKCNDYLSVQLDQIDEDMPEYMLEVSSPGAEKELRNMSEIQKAIDQYVHIELPNMIYEGVLKGITEQNEIQLYFNAKGRFKTILIPYNEIKFIRLAVKI